MQDFEIALAAYQAHIEAGTVCTPEGQRAFRQFLDTAPLDLLAELHAKGIEIGVIPKPSGYARNGEPVYSVEALAEHFDVPMAEVREAAAAWEAERPGTITYVDGTGIARVI